MTAVSNDGNGGRWSTGDGGGRVVVDRPWWQQLTQICQPCNILKRYYIFEMLHHMCILHATISNPRPSIPVSSHILKCCGARWPRGRITKSPRGPLRDGETIVHESIRKFPVRVESTLTLIPLTHDGIPIVRHPVVNQVAQELRHEARCRVAVMSRSLGQAASQCRVERGTRTMGPC